jgi:small subunit ribosomal protein S17
MATQTKNTAKKTAAPKKEAAPKAAAPKAAKAAAAPKAADAGIQRRRVVTGTVVSDKMQKTIVVKVDRRVRHGMYLKYVTRSERYKAHDEKNQAKVGDIVTLIESRPLSRDKRWALQSIVRKGGQAPEANV